MRVPALGRRRRVAALAAFAASAALLVHVLPPVAADDEPAAAAPPAAAAGLDDAGYFAVADGLQRRLDALWSPRLGRYEPGPGAATAQVNADLLLVHSLAALRDHADRRAPTTARGGGALPRRSADLGPDAAARRRSADHRAGMGLGSGAKRPPHGPRHRGRRRTRPRLPGARRARPGPEHGRAYPRRRSTSSPRAATGAGLRSGSISSTGTARCSRPTRSSTAPTRPWPTAWRSTSHASSPAGRHRGEGRQPRRRPALPLPAGARPADTLERRLRRVRQHRAELLALLRPGARRRHARAGAAGAAARVGPARDRRLLDPRRLSQLGHRPRLLSLASAQEGRAGAARPDRRRGTTGAPARPKWGAWAKWLLDRGLTGLRRAGRARGADSGGDRVRRGRGPRGPLERLSRRHPHRGQRLPRARGRARPPGRAASAGAVLVRPRHGPARRHHAGLQHRDRAGQPGRDSLRRPRHRPALRRPAGGRREHRRVRARGLRPDRAGERPRAARHASTATGPTPPASRRCGSRALRAARA